MCLSKSSTEMSCTIDFISRSGIMYSQVGTGQEETAPRCSIVMCHVRVIVAVQTVWCITRLCPYLSPVHLCNPGPTSIMLPPVSTDFPHVVRSMCATRQTRVKNHNRARRASVSLMTGTTATSCAVEHAPWSGTMCSQMWTRGDGRVLLQQIAPERVG